ncbi:MAG TPA: ferritin-like domain-containing protein [Burkholderiales bacterium]|nr:ferritin-like domain-containing protein [Burkholderiales bacterium]
MARTSQREAALGPNKTGIATSPKDIAKMLAGMDSKLAMPSSEGDERGMADIRTGYIETAEPVGSMPPPATLKGAAKSGAKMMMGERPQVLLDKLGERLAVERTATRLYDALIAKFRAHPQDPVTDEELVHIRNEEAKHFALVGDCIEKLGGDPTAQTPCADVAGVEALGLMQVITDPKTTIAQSLHAILIAELTDNAAWEDLITLADKMGQTDMIPDFEQALAHEAEHLATVRSWLQALVAAESDLVKTKT